MDRQPQRSTLSAFVSLTLKELAALAVLAAIVVVALKHAASSWWWLSSATMIVSFWAATMAVTVSKTAVWSRGFLACLGLYGILVLASPRNEMSSTGFLPTTQLLARLDSPRWKKSSPNELQPSFPETDYSISTYTVRVPDYEGHYRTGHLLIGLTLGLLGGRLARCAAPQRT